MGRHISDAQRAVLKEVFSDAELAADFLLKTAGYIYLTTHANDCILKFEGGSGLHKFKGLFKYKRRESEKKNG